MRAKIIIVIIIEIVLVIIFIVITTKSNSNNTGWAGLGMMGRMSCPLRWWLLPGSQVMDSFWGQRRNGCDGGESFLRV